MSSAGKLGLFDAFGVEIEYMIVDAAGLDVAPACDRLMEKAAGEPVSELERGEAAWSNELALHVLEFKCNGPAPTLTGLATLFQGQVAEAGALLKGLGCRLLPTGAHPWMDPHTQTRLWPHEYSPIYQAYDRIFGCKGHGWSNLQSMHINLPFDGDAEFARLHAAIRALLPVMPALTASSPVLDGRPTGLMDSRMEVYRHNAERVPSVAGQVVPEAVFNQADYERDIFQRMYRDMEPLDPEGVLRHQFLNSRGAIARFDRGAIEIRVLDTQECPAADLAAAGLICAGLRALSDGRWTDPTDLQGFDTRALADIFLRCVRDADQAVVDDPAWLAALGLPATPVTAGEVWTHLLETCLPESLPESGRDPAWAAPLAAMLGQGCLARRIMRALGDDTRTVRHGALREVYGQLADCLERGEVFHG